jgi:hypothetical protein
LSIAQLKDAIERNFFKKQSELSLLGHSAKVLYRFYQEGQYSTASSYEDALKVFVKYQMKQARKDDFATIKSLYSEDSKKGF